MRNFSSQAKLSNLDNLVHIPISIQEIFSVSDIQSFNALALEIFYFQAKNNLIYRDYLNALKCHPEDITQLESIPFLPIELFKHQKIMVGDGKAEMIFKSSGTGGLVSTHHIKDSSIYLESLLSGFEYFYGNPVNYCLLALLPSYIERKDASLVFMMKQLMETGRHPSNGFYLDDFQSLHVELQKLKSQKQPTLLIGVTYALLDFIAKYEIEFPELIVMETGGMKGKRKEMLREEAHQLLKKSFHKDAIHSEYGMTELLSQAYSKGQGIFNTPPWMKIFIREIRDPFSYARHGKSGVINVVDLANINSCSFIATQDIGRKSEEGSFEILGRMDDSDLRGCNLMIE